MSTEANEFRDWMDRNGIKTSDLTGPLQISEQTLRHWRSKGVPERRQSHVNYIMASWATPAAPLGQTLILHPTTDQFKKWNVAAISGPQPKTIEQWAIEGLDQLAAEAEDEAQHLSLVAEDATSYGNGKAQS